MRRRVWRRRGAGPFGKARLGERIKAFRARAGEIAALERTRWTLWPPVALMGGAAWHMTARADPPLWPACAAFAVAIAVYAAVASLRTAMWPNLQRAAAMGAALLAMGALGVLAGAARTHFVEGRPIAAELGQEPVAVTGWVMEVEAGATRPRLKILAHAIADRETSARYVRLSVKRGEELAPGRAVRCLAIVRPPEAPLAPGGYDSARRSYFQSVGASGFALGRCRPVELGPPPAWRDAALLRLAALRRDVSDSVRAMVAGEGGALAVALITGDRSYLQEDTQVALRDAGLGHLLSVSGLHMGLAAGSVFAFLHAALALIPWLALRFPIRKWAAAGALVSALLYLILSGVSVPAQRAFVMTAVALGAVLADRPAFTMHSLGVAAALIVLIQPESVVDPGAQMSFAATAALIAAFERAQRPTPVAFSVGPLIGGLDKLWRGMRGMLIASLVAGLATDPFALYHFQRLTVYGLAANLAVAPIVTFVLAPAALVAAVMAPFGLAEAPLAVMGASLEMVKTVSEVFAGRPESVRPLPAATAGPFLLAVAAVILWCLSGSALRWAGAAMLAGAAAWYALEPRPAAYVDGGAQVVTARSVSGPVTLGAQAFVASRLRGLAGEPDLPKDKLVDCAAPACFIALKGGVPLFLVTTETGFEAACRPGAVVAARPSAPEGFVRRCRPALLLDLADRRAHGGAAIYVGPDGQVSARRVLTGPDRRPWTGPLMRSDE